VLGALVIATVAAVAWGALAFGAVYPWAYAPLAIACAVIGIGGLVVARRGPPLGALTVGLVGIALAIATQLLPLPRNGLARLSPNADRFLNAYQSTYGVLRPVDLDAVPATDTPPSRPLSIAPAHTVTGLVLFVAFALFFLGTARLLSTVGGLTIARPLIAFGIGLALVGIAQDALTAHQAHPLIYGFWKPQFESRAFGPFVNPNHFAGWMQMALPLGLALF
jgi:hypothetical protein